VLGFLALVAPQLRKAPDRSWQQLSSLTPTVYPPPRVANVAAMACVLLLPPRGANRLHRGVIEPIEDGRI
jgi:hypothetical protein